MTILHDYTLLAITPNRLLLQAHYSIALRRLFHDTFLIMLVISFEFPLSIIINHRAGTKLRRTYSIGKSSRILQEGCGIPKSGMIRLLSERVAKTP